ncbi:MAG: leucine-rich repeat domain-containing protein [Clostridia bacterium]|nr:leucine-rich repeat domain-containing protein [Clostridia bacterium]
MKKISKIVSVLLAAVIIFSIAPLSGFVGVELPALNVFGTKAKAAITKSGTCGNYLTWTFDDVTGELVISGVGDMDAGGSMYYLPWNSVTSKIKTVLIGDGVTSIDDYAFYSCKNLTSLTIGNSVKSIGDCAFAFCSGLTNVTIPDSVEIIGEKTFLYCSGIENLSIPDSVKTIGYGAFNDCNELKTVTIGKGVTSIGDNAFLVCTNLRSITVDSANTAYASDSNGVLFNKDKSVLIQYPLGSTNKSYSIPNGVTSIRNYAFSNCRYLENITLPDGLENIGENAFYGCEIGSVSIPDSVTSMGAWAFAACHNITTVTIGKGISTLEKGVFHGCMDLISVTIPISVTSIKQGAFYYCAINDVYYGGSNSDWDRIEIAKENTNLTSAKIHYNSMGPAGSGSTETPETPDNIPGYDPSVIDANLIPTPSRTTIKYGDSIVLHVDPDKIPGGGSVGWYANNDNFIYHIRSDGETCSITPITSGKTTFTAIVYDVDYNIVAIDTQEMTSKAGFFDQIIAFFKALFGLNRTYAQVFIY